MEMGIGRLDLDKPETGPSEDACTWPKFLEVTGSWIVKSTGSKANPPPHSLAPLREEALGLTRIKSHNLGGLFVCLFDCLFVSFSIHRLLSSITTH